MNSPLACFFHCFIINFHLFHSLNFIRSFVPLLHFPIRHPPTIHLLILLLLLLLILLLFIITILLLLTILLVLPVAHHLLLLNFLHHLLILFAVFSIFPEAHTIMNYQKVLIKQVISPLHLIIFFMFEV